MDHEVCVISGINADPHRPELIVTGQRLVFRAGQLVGVVPVGPARLRIQPREETIARSLESGPFFTFKTLTPDGPPLRVLGVRLKNTGAAPVEIDHVAFVYQNEAGQPVEALRSLGGTHQGGEYPLEPAPGARQPLGPSRCGWATEF